MEEFAPLFERLVARLRREESDLQGVLVAGSHGEADRFSDVDLVAFTLGAPLRQALSWFETDTDGRLVHVSAAIERLEPAGTPEPASWSLGFPALDAQRWIWGTQHARDVLGGDPSVHIPGASGELEDFVEFYMKCRRATVDGDSVRLRWAARMLAEYSVGLLREFNPVQTVAGPSQALAAALALTNTPAYHREDFLVCTGLHAANDEAIGRAASRLIDGVLDFLRAHPSEPPRHDDVWRELFDGTLHAYVAQSRR